MTTPQQNFAFAANTVVVGINPATAINQGDILKVVAGLAEPITANTDVPFGVAGDTNPVVSLGDTLTKVNVIRAGVVRLFGKASELFTPNAKVWYDTNAQTVTAVDPGGAVVLGRVREIVAVTAAADGSTRVLIEPNYEGIA